jgi:hypothetical protein
MSRFEQKVMRRAAMHSKRQSLRLSVKQSKKR